MKGGLKGETATRVHGTGYNQAIMANKDSVKGACITALTKASCPFALNFTSRHYVSALEHSDQIIIELHEPEMCLFNQNRSPVRPRSDFSVF